MLEGLTRLGGRLLLRIRVNGQRRTASLEWDTPPAVGDVERALLASVGIKVRELGDLELPRRSGRKFADAVSWPVARGAKSIAHTIARDGAEA